MAASAVDQYVCGVAVVLALDYPGVNVWVWLVLAHMPPAPVSTEAAAAWLSFQCIFFTRLVTRLVPIHGR